MQQFISAGYVQKGKHYANRIVVLDEQAVIKAWADLGYPTKIGFDD